MCHQQRLEQMYIKKRNAATKMQSVVRLKLATKRKKEREYLRSVEQETARLANQRAGLFMGRASDDRSSHRAAASGSADTAGQSSNAVVSGDAVSTQNGDDTTADQSALDQSAADAPLPEGWVQEWDHDSGYAYYVNTSTGDSQWDRPSLARRIRAVTRFMARS